MIWSVSILAPNVQALPRNVFGKLTSPPHHAGEVGLAKRDRVGAAQLAISLGKCLSTSPGCVMTPVTALAAATAGLERYTIAFGWPIRPGKFRLVVLRHTSPSPSTPMWPPRQAPHVAVVQAAPAARNVPINPSFSAWIATWCEDGVMISRTPGATLRFSSTAAARRRSVMRELVHDPMKTWSSLVPATSDSGA